MAFDMTVDHYTRDKDSGEAKITRHTPFLRIRVEQHPPLFLRNGNVYDEAGELIKDINWPDWLYDEMTKTDEGQLRTVGFTKEGGTICSVSKSKTKKE